MRKDPFTTNLGGTQLRTQASPSVGASVLDRFKERVRSALQNEVGSIDLGADVWDMRGVKSDRYSDPIIADVNGHPHAHWATGEVYPVMAGGDGTNPVTHPLGPPTISGNEITVDTMLKQPTRITRMLMDLTLQRFFVDRVFTNAGGVTGGAVIYDQATENELYSDRDVERVESGQEFPIVSSSRRAPKIAEVEKYGGKFYTTDEARDRNDAAAFVNETRKLANTIVRKINAVGVAVLLAAIDANGGLSDMDGNDWSAAIPNGSDPTAPGLTPGADLAEVHLTAEQRELGLEFNILLVNPVQKYEWNLFYGKNAAQALSDLGFDEMYSTNRLTAGTALAVASGQVGEMRIESPLQTETVREGAPQMRQRTWTQSSVRPMFFVTNPFAVMRINGL